MILYFNYMVFMDFYLKFNSLDTNNILKLLSPIRKYTQADGKLTSEKKTFIRYVFQHIGNFFQRLTSLISRKAGCQWFTNRKLVKYVSQHLQPISSTSVEEIKKLYREFKHRIDKNNEDLKKIKIELDKFKNKNTIPANDLISKKVDSNSFEASDDQVEMDLLWKIFDEISINDDDVDLHEDVLENPELSDETVESTDKTESNRPVFLRTLGKRQLITPAPTTASSSKKTPPELKKTKAMHWDKRGLNAANSKKRLYFAGFAKVAAEEIKKFKNITEENILEILTLLIGSENGEKWKKQLDIYGPKMLDSAFLINLIKGMCDKKKKSKAIKTFIKWHLTAIGHKFSLGGSLGVQNATKACQTQVQLEGWWQHFTHAKILASIETFFEKNPKASELRQNYQKEIVEALKLSCRLTEKASKKDIEKYVKNHKAGHLGTIPAGWRKHAVGITTSENLIAYSNQGQCSEGWVSGIWIGFMSKEEMFNHQFVQKVVGRLSAPKKEMMHYYEGGLVDSQLQNTMADELGLKKCYKINKKDQSVGNCTWVSAQDELQALILFAFIKQRREELLQKLEEGNLTDLLNIVSFREMYKGIKDHYKNGKEAFDALPESERVNIVKKDCLSGYFEADQKTLKPHTLFFMDILGEAKAYYRSWNFFDAAAEMDHMLQLVKELNRNNTYLNSHSEFKLISEISRKFSESKKMERLADKDPVGAKMLSSKLKELIRIEGYKLDDCIISLEKYQFKDGFIPVVQKLFDGKIEGSFMLCKPPGSVQEGDIYLFYRHSGKTFHAPIHCKKGADGKCHYSIKYNNDEKTYTFSHLLDINDHLDKIFVVGADKKLLLQHPIYDQKLIKRYATNNFEKD